MNDPSCEITCFSSKFYEQRVFAMAELLVSFGIENVDFTFPRLAAALDKFHESRGEASRG